MFADIPKQNMKKRNHPIESWEPSAPQTTGNLHKGPILDLLIIPEQYPLAILK